MTPVLQQWNQLSPVEAAEGILPCNGAQLWAERLAAMRPFASEADLLRAAADLWHALPVENKQHAFNSHPRLGQHHAPTASAQSLAWSKSEQFGLQRRSEPSGPGSGSEHSNAAIPATPESQLAAANQAYEAKFGRIFLLCASGKSAAEVLAALSRRLGNDPVAEFAEAVDAQRRITLLRLHRWLGLPVPRCEDV